MKNRIYPNNYFVIQAKKEKQGPGDESDKLDNTGKTNIYFHARFGAALIRNHISCQ